MWENEKHSLEQIFADTGQSQMFEQIGYKIWVSNEWAPEDLNILHLFLQVYWFDEEQALFVDDFFYHFRIFKAMYQFNDMSRYHF